MKKLLKLNLVVNPIMKYERSVEDKYFYINNYNYLKTTNDHLLFIHSKDDNRVSFKSNINAVKKADNPNITILEVNEKKHNPTYTKEAVELMTKTINEYISLVNNKTLDTLEKRKEFFKDITAFDMTVQDPHIENIIITFLEE